MTRRSSLVFVALCASLAAFALAATPAQAAQVHRFDKSLTPAGGFVNPLGVAINQSTEEVYVGDFSAGAVYAFEASGTPDPTHPKFTKADGSTPYPFANPYDLAVDNTVGSDHGDIYVAEYGAGAVSQFDPEGKATGLKITAASIPPADPGSGGIAPTGVAVGPNGDIYLGDVANSVVDEFSPAGSFIAQFGSGHLSNVQGVAVDSSGDVYVADANLGLIEFGPAGACANSCTPIYGAPVYGVAFDSSGNIFADQGGQVTEFSSAAEPLETFGSSTSKPPFGGLSGASYSIAISESTDDAYVTDFSGPAADLFEAIIAPTLTIRPFTSSGASFATLSAEVDPAGGGNVIACHFEYGLESGNYSLGTTPCLSPSPTDAEVGTLANPIESPTEVHADLTGLATLKTYHYRLVATDANGTIESSDHEFSLLPNLPSVSGTSSSEETPTSATLTAGISPGFGSTVYRFQYGTAPSYGSSTLIGPVGSDDTVHRETANISGLLPATTYHFRVVAISYVGTINGPDQTFTTPDQPTVGGGSTSNVTSSTATLEAQVNPELAATTFHFQYGTSLSYGSSTPESGSVGTNGSTHDVSANLAGLAPATTYHFRIVATNRFGATTGFDQAFTTTPAPAVTTPLAKNCKKGLVRRHGKCVKKPYRKSNHHRRGGKR